MAAKRSMVLLLFIQIRSNCFRPASAKIACEQQKSIRLFRDSRRRFREDFWVKKDRSTVTWYVSYLEHSLIEL